MSRFSLAAQRSAITAVVRPKEHARGISRIPGSVALMAIIAPILAATLFLLLGPTPLPGLVWRAFCNCSRQAERRPWTTASPPRYAPCG